MQFKRLLSIDQTQDYLGLGKTRIYQLIAQHQLQVIKAGRRTLVSQAELERYVSTLPRAGRSDDESGSSQPKK